MELNLDLIFFDERSGITCKVCGKLPKKEFVARRITPSSAKHLSGDRKYFANMKHHYMNFVFVDSPDCLRRFEDSWNSPSSGKILDELYDAILETQEGKRP